MPNTATGSSGVVGARGGWNRNFRMEERRFSPYGATQTTRNAGKTVTGRSRGDRGLFTSTLVPPSRRRSLLAAPSTKPPYQLKEVILLDKKNARTVIRGPKKAELVERGEDFEFFILAREGHTP